MSTAPKKSPLHKKGPAAKKVSAPKAKAAPKVKAPKEPKAAVPERPSQNGITLPKEGTASALVWDIADKLSKVAKKPARRKDVMDECLTAGINQATANTQFGRWRKFNGLGAYSQEA